MKRIFVYVMTGLCLAGVFAGCKQDPAPSIPQDIWKKDTLSGLLHHTKWRVEKIKKVAGTDTVDLDSDPGFQNSFFAERKSILLGFHSPQVVVWGASPQTGNPHLRDGAETYHFTDRGVRPTNMVYEWDDTLETIVARSGSGTGIVTAPAGFTAVLDKSSIVAYKTYREEEQSNIPSNLTFKVDTGGTTYLCQLKPVWYYDIDPILHHYYYYVVFP